MELLNPPKDPNVAESSVIDENKIGVELSDRQNKILRRGVGSKRPQSETLDKMSGKFIITENAEKWAKLRQRIARLRTAKPIIQETGEGIDFIRRSPKGPTKGRTYGWHKVPMHPSNAILIRPNNPTEQMDMIKHFRKIQNTKDFAPQVHGSVQQFLPLRHLRNNVMHMSGQPFKRHATISRAQGKSFKKGDIVMRRVGGKPEEGKYGTVGDTFYIEQDSPKGEVFNATSKYNRARLKIARIRMAAAQGIRMNPQHGRTIADAFDTMQHNPNSPKVKASYNALINETIDQAKALQNKGIKFSPEYGKKGADYGGDIGALHDDIEKNKNLFYRKSDNDYKGFEDNPMFRLTDIRNSRGHRMRANDVFRSVHDINGHNLAGRSDFTPLGEHKAYLQHRKMYSPLASKALFTETAGQANWSNYSKKHGAKNRYFQKMNRLGNIKFPQQKAGLLPDNIVGGSWHQRLGKQRSIRVKPSIRTMQAKAGIKLRYSDNIRNYDNLVKTPEGRQWIEDNKLGWYIGKDGTPRNVVNNPRDSQKSLEETPGEGDLYVVANTKDVRDPHGKEISDGHDRWDKEMPDVDVSIGGFTDEKGIMEYDSSAAFRSDSPQKAMGFAKNYNQTSYMVISGKNAEVNFYKPDGSLIPKSK